MKRSTAEQGNGPFFESKKGPKKPRWHWKQTWEVAVAGGYAVRALLQAMQASP